MAASAQRVQSQPVAPVLQFCRAISSLCPAALSSHRRNLHANLEESAGTAIVFIILVDDVSSYRFLIPFEGVEHCFGAREDDLHILA